MTAPQVIAGLWQTSIQSFMFGYVKTFIIRIPRAVQHALTLASFIERQLYPTNAKYHLQSIEKLPITTHCRVQHDDLLNDTI